MQPVLMPPNRFPHFYRGGARITDLRGVPAPCPRAERADQCHSACAEHRPSAARECEERSPEEWLASTTTRFGAAPAGLSALPDGRSLHEAVAAQPRAWLGPEHLAAFGVDTGVLVKLLDAGERLPVHAHPDRAWARRHLGCRYGKTEAWYVVAADEDARVHLGFHEDVPAAELAGRVARQDTAALLDAMHVRPVGPGDGILVPAGWPHVIGAGILVVEAQEPTDFSILLEWAGFDLDGATEGHLGLGFPTALGAVDTRRRTPAEVDALLRPATHGRADTLLDVLPPGADLYFRVHVARPATAVAVPAGFAVVAVLAGAGSVGAVDGVVPVSRGDVLAVPYDAGDWTLRGEVEAVVCRPALVGPS